MLLYTGYSTAHRAQHTEHSTRNPGTPDPWAHAHTKGCVRHRHKAHKSTHRGHTHCVLCVVCCVLCPVSCVLCSVCCVLYVYVLCDVFCVLRVLFYMMCAVLCCVVCCIVSDAVCADAEHMLGIATGQRRSTEGGGRVKE
jgi:hypothetical protein